MNVDDLSWEPPGPGTWNLLADHYQRPITAASESFMQTWTDATTGFMTRVGVPIESATMRAVNGLPYVSIATSGGGRKPPPAWALRIAVFAVPSLRRAQKRLGEVLADRPWNDGISRWYDDERPKAVARMLAVASVKPDGLDDTTLAAHLDEVTALQGQSMAQHMALHEHDAFAPGLFVLSADRWGIDRATSLRLLSGASPASTGASPELDALRAAVAGRHADTIDDLRSLDDHVATALDQFLLHHGDRLLDGYDVDCSTLAEQPTLVCWLATGPTPADRSDDHAAAVAAARSHVPDADRAEFDRLLAEGRAAYGVRDDNSGILSNWSTGLLRRAMLATGRRLETTGRMHDASLAIEEYPSVLAHALRGGHIDEPALARRRLHRATVRAADAPRRLGPEAPPPPVGMPGPLGLVFQILTLYEMGTETVRTPMAGTGIGDTPYTGPARLVLGGNVGLTEFEPGDVLVAPMTSPSYNMLLSLAGAVVTDEGGPLSHAAIMARELDLPAVVGAGRATQTIRNHDIVTVDPRAGRVTVVHTTL